MKKIILIAIAVIVIGIVGSVGILVWRANEAVENLSIDNIDFSQIADGTYRGGYNAGLVAVDVEATVADGQVRRIEILKHENGRGTPAEAIINSIIRAQSLQVDEITGATVSSRVTRKAIENALKKGLQ